MKYLNRGLSIRKISILFKKVILIFFITVYYPELAFSQWTMQNYYDTSYYLTNINFLNSNNGLAAGYHFIYPNIHDGIIYKTTNAGLNWNVIFTDTNFSINNTYFISSSEWLAIGGGNFVSQSKIIKSTNGGLSWFYLNTEEIPAMINSIIFFNNICFATCVGGIFKSTNSGINWTNTVASFGLYSSSYFLNSNTGWGAFDQGEIYKTTNGGANWSFQLLYGYRDVHGISFVNENTGYVVYDSIQGSPYNSVIFKTTNGGDNWTRLNTSQMGHIWALDFINASTGFITGAGASIILKTTSGGDTWFESLHSGQSYSVRRVKFLDVNTGYACGSSAVILKTTTGGVIGINPIGSEVPKDYMLSQNYPNPFNPTTRIKFAIPKSGLVKITVFDLLGREVETLVNEIVSQGIYEVEWDGNNMASGLYFYKLASGDFTETKKMVLVK